MVDTVSASVVSLFVRFDWPNLCQASRKAQESRSRSRPISLRAFTDAGNRTKSDIPDEYHGRGGTSYLPVIDYINSHPRYRNALLIYFTDGYGDGEIPKPKVRQTVWVLIGGDYLSLKNPYGDVVLID